MKVTSKKKVQQQAANQLQSLQQRAMQGANLLSLLIAIAKPFLSVHALLLMLICAQANAAPILNSYSENELALLHIRLAHIESGKYVTVDPQTGRVSATSSVSNDATLFQQILGSSGSFLFMSAALPNHFLSISAMNESYYFSVTNPHNGNESSGSSSSSGSGSVDTSGSGGSDSLTNQVHDEWQRVKPHFIYSHLKLKIDGKDCYLAFEEDGSPVSDPCNISETDPRASIVIRPR